MIPIPPPGVSWQFTGNHWLTLPCIHPVDGALHAVGVLHRGARAAVEFAGCRDFTDGAGPGLLTPRVRVNGVERRLAEAGIAWERALAWLPTFTTRVDELVLRGTVFAPFGRDADMAGAVYALTIENRGSKGATVEVAMDGLLGHRQQRVRTPRAYDDAHRVVAAAEGIVVMEGAALPGVVSLAVGADGEAQVQVREGVTPGFTLAVNRAVPAGATVEVAFYLAAGPERDGAVATVGVLRRRGWRALLSATREAVRSLEQETGNERVDRLVMDHLLFAYFYAVGRALDDAHYYLVRSRAPWNGRGMTVRDWEALMWTVPAVQLADPQLGRELLLRMCEVHGYAPGQGVHYLDGTLFAPGFLLEGIAAYPIAIDRYIRDSGDDQVVEEPLVADALYGAEEDLRTRRDPQVPLYSTDVTLSGETAAQPFTLHGNAAVALALDILRRTLDEEASKEVPDPDATRAALRRHLVTEKGGKALFASATDLAGQVVAADDPNASALWLPLLEGATREESIFRRTAKALPASRPELAYQIARLLGPDSAAALAWLQAAALDQGKAAELVDEAGLAVGNGGDASLSGLLAYTLWFVMHTSGTRG